MFVCMCAGVDLTLTLLETWGDQHYVGLTGIELLGCDGAAIPVDMGMIEAEPHDLHHLPGHEQDQRTLDKSVNLPTCLPADCLSFCYFHCAKQWYRPAIPKSRYSERPLC